MAASNKIYTKQSSFANGEVSFDMWGRDDYAKYFVSAKTMENFIPLPYGGAQNRPGTYFIAEVKDSSKKVKLLPFQFSVEQAYIIEAGENYFRYYKDGGQIIDGSTIVETTTTYTEDYLFNLKTAQSADTLYLCNSSYVPKTLTRTSHYDWVFEDFNYESGPFRSQNVTDTTITPSAVTGTGITLTASDDIFEDDHVGSLWQISHDVTGQVINASYTSSVSSASSIVSDTLTMSSDGNLTVVVTGTWVGTLSIEDYVPVNKRWTVIRSYTANGTYTIPITNTAAINKFRARMTSQTSGTCVVTVTDGTSTVNAAFSPVPDYIKCKGSWSLITHGTWTGKIQLQRSKDEGVTWDTIRSYTSAADINVNDSGETDDLVYLRIVYTYTSGTCYVDLNAYSFANDGVVLITDVTSGTVATATVLTDLAFVTATEDWAEGSWSPKNGYPSCVKFYQNRLGFAGSTKDPLTFWMSQTGDYTNFLVNSPTEDSDSIVAPLVSEGLNSIRSMVSLSDMIAFTAGGEWKVGTGSESTALTPTSIIARQQGYRGASNIAPLIIGNRILYCQEMGSTIRDIGYSLTDDVYKGDDLTMLARHLFKNNEIVDWAFQQEPDGIIWGVRDDGVLLSFTYNKEQDVYAWARHITDGEYESVAAIPGDGQTEVYFVVKREINGETKRFIEKLMPRMTTTDPRDQFFVDCGLSLDEPITITGATKASPIVITAIGHGLSNGDYVDFSDIKGMTELNGFRGKVANKTTDTFELVNMDDDTNIDGTSYTTYKSGGYVRKAVITISNLNHLEGKTATILADGSVNSQQVVTDGSITLDDYASRVHVGIGYECNLETLNLDFPMADGTIQGRTKSIKNVTVRFENTYGGFVGINGDDYLEIIEQQLSETYGKPADLFTGDKKVSPYTDFETSATVYIRQSDPLPMTVLAIMSEVEIGD